MTSGDVSMQMLAKRAPVKTTPAVATNPYPSTFTFNGDSLSLHTRLNTMADATPNRIIDARITVNGREIKAFNQMCYTCTIAWGSLVYFPLCFMCCDWWKNWVYPAYDIDIAVYRSLSKLFYGPKLRNISLTVKDSNFGPEKAAILCQLVAQSRINGFTFINTSGNWNFLEREYSDFSQNMRPIKRMANVMSDIRWENQICM